ncbi:MAG: serine protein kinase [Ignavibacteriae bacterium]|nr:serine protein kinase [Ignavibacteriota bacterium]NOH00414.1 serine protein kinase [Ignavibacteriota bacterium]
MASERTDYLKLIRGKIDQDEFREQHWEGSLENYLALIQDNPLIVRNAYQRLYDMILSYGFEPRTDLGDDVYHYAFFDDPIDGGKDAVFGLDESLTDMVGNIKSAAFGYGVEKRVLMLHGPVGSSKSTIARLLKKGVEAYSHIAEGSLYSFEWQIEEDGEWEKCPMHEEPLMLVPEPARSEIIEDLNKRRAAEYRLRLVGDMCPFCRYHYSSLLERYDGDWEKLLGHIKVTRLLLSEKDRIGIGTFQPKDEKNQDSTELTGDINYRKIAMFGSDSDPRAFNFDGEFNVANRGVIEFIEVLKLDVAFLYDLLGASQEHSIKPKKFAQTYIDEVIIGHTNEPEYKKLQNNELMEAFRDRTIKIDVPYNVKLEDEVRIYEKDFNTRSVSKHIAPHTIDVAAMWAILTRLDEPKNASLTLMQKLKLYGGKTLPGFTKDNVRELREESAREGMEGISPRYIQDKISNALVRDGEPCINPFMVLNEIEEGLQHHSLINSEEVKKRYRDLLTVVKEEYEDIVKNEVQRAISADEESIARLAGNYIDNVKAYTQKEKIKNKYTGRDEEPDERLMRSIEEKIGITDSRKDDFRQEIMNYIGALALEGKTFTWKSNERLQKALELKLFEDQKDTIKLTSIVSTVVDRDTQEKIDVVKSRMIKNHNYCEICATDVLNFVASIFARGDTKEEE